MKKLAVVIAVLISFLSFSSFSFAQGVMTNTEIDASKKPAKKIKKAHGSKHTKGSPAKAKKIKPAKKKTEEPATPGKTNP